MESPTFERRSKLRYNANPDIKVKIFPGHYATGHSHINFYIDLNHLKSHCRAAKEVAKVFTERFLYDQTDTIVCLEGTQVLGAFLGDALAHERNSASFDNDIAVVVPDTSSHRMIFRDNQQPLIYDKNVLLFVSSVSTGQTIQDSVECLSYYGAKLSGVAALFSAADKVDNTDIYHLFGAGDVVGYASHRAGDCPLCASGKKLDAIITAYGYSKI